MFVFKYTGLSLKLKWSIPVATLISTNPEVSMRKFELSLSSDILDWGDTGL